MNRFLCEYRWQLQIEYCCEDYNFYYKSFTNLTWQTVIDEMIKQKK
jgi:hypothetical protein